MNEFIGRPTIRIGKRVCSIAQYHFRVKSHMAWPCFTFPKHSIDYWSILVKRLSNERQKRPAVCTVVCILPYFDFREDINHQLQTFGSVISLVQVRLGSVAADKLVDKILKQKFLIEEWADSNLSSCGRYRCLNEYSFAVPRVLRGASNSWWRRLRSKYAE